MKMRQPSQGMTNPTPPTNRTPYHDMTSSTTSNWSVFSLETFKLFDEIWRSNSLVEAALGRYR
jgi:hypothetical protein